MGHTRHASTQHLAERRCWEVARRDDSRVARRLCRKPEGDGVYRLAEGAGLDECCHLLQRIGVMPLLAEVHGAASPRERLPCVQDWPALRREAPLWDSAHQGLAPPAVP
jgi:hypothetical protein